MFDTAAQQFLVVEHDGTGGVRLDAQNGFSEFGLAVALDAGDSQHLTLRDVERDIVHNMLAVVVHDRQVTDFEGNGPGPGRFLLERQAHGAAHHRRGQFSGGSRRLCLPHHFAPADDRDGV